VPGVGSFPNDCRPPLGISKDGRDAGRDMLGVRPAKFPPPPPR
jgi:hypothetical protein